MKRKNRILAILVMVTTALFAQSAVAQLQKDARGCIKPRFSRFNPVHLSEVAPGSTVSFVANHATAKNTIEVTAKGIKINDLKVTDNKSFYVVEFELPESLVGTYARLHISANAKLGSKICQHKDGWLLKISGGQSAASSKSTTESTDVKKPVIYSSRLRINIK